MKRILCLLLVLVMMCSLCVQAFADGDILYCRMCGKKIPADSRVCSYCGETVVHVDEDAAVKTLGSESSVTQTPAAPSAAPAPAAPSVASPAASTDVKTALSQSSAPSPVTQTSTAVPGPFNTTLGTSGSPGRVRVTKSPTSESVPYGGSATFIAHAANATSVTWYISDASASIICAASDAPYSVSGLYVSGANSDTLYLSGIPSWWNGCQVQACFTGDGGPVYTEAARIWTYQPAQYTDTSCWSWWDWFCYYYRDDPYYWDYPWDWYNYWVSYPHCAPFWFHPSPNDHDFDLNPYRPNPKPSPAPKPSPEPTKTDSVYIVGPNDYGHDGSVDVVKIEKSDNQPWDYDYLERVWNFMYGDQATTQSQSTQQNNSTPPSEPQGSHVSQGDQNGGNAPGSSQVTEQYVEDVDNHPATIDTIPSHTPSDNKDVEVISEWVDW